MKQIEATILGQSYALACPPGGEELLRDAVAMVDREMSAIRNAGKVKARERMAVLAALNLAYQRAEIDAAKAASVSEGAVPTLASAAATTDASRRAAEAGEPEDLAGLDVDHLIRRIDAALGDDGHLL